MSEMRHWDIWAEGWADNGGGSKAQLIATGIEASTFAEAVEKHAELNPEFKKYISKYQDGNYCYWRCRLFDNEGDARRFLG